MATRLTRLRYVFDTSVFTHLHRDEVTDALSELDGHMMVTSLTKLEFGYSAASAQDWVVRSQVIEDLCETVFTTEDDFGRALAVQKALAAQGLKGRKPPDLLIAAVAERLDAVALHYDNDYALISGITGQTHQWVVPKGSLATKS